MKTILILIFFTLIIQSDDQKKDFIENVFFTKKNILEDHYNKYFYFIERYASILSKDNPQSIAVIESDLKKIPPMELFRLYHFCELSIQSNIFPLEQTKKISVVKKLIHQRQKNIFFELESENKYLKEEKRNNVQNFFLFILANIATQAVINQIKK